MGKTSNTNMEDELIKGLGVSLAKTPLMVLLKNKRMPLKSRYYMAIFFVLCCLVVTVYYSGEHSGVLICFVCLYSPLFLGMEYAKYLVLSLQPSTVHTIQMKAVDCKDNDSIVLISKDVEVTIDSWKILVSLYSHCQQVGDTCLILSWKSIGIEHVITESFLFGCDIPDVATGRGESHDILCIGRCRKAKEKELYDTYYGYQYHNKLVDGKGESEQSLVVTDRQVEYYVLGLYAKNDVVAIKKSTNLAQIDNLRLHETVNTHAFFMNSPNHHFKSSYRNNQPVVNEETRIIKTLQDMVNKHSNQAYARIAASKVLMKKHMIFMIQAKKRVYAIIDQNGNVGMRNDNQLNETDESRKAIADASNKKQALLAHNWNDSDQYDIYFESCKLLPKENAALTLIQPNLAAYIYWWPHCLACCAWIFGTIWIIICSWLILLYSINFGAGASYPVSEAAPAVETEYQDEICSTAWIYHDVTLIEWIDCAVSGEAAAITTGSNSLYDEWIRIDGVQLWFLAFLLAVLEWLLCCLPLLCSISSCFCGFKWLWQPQQRMYYDHGKYYSHEVLGLEEREVAVTTIAGLFVGLVSSVIGLILGLFRNNTSNNNGVINGIYHPHSGGLTTAIADEFLYDCNGFNSCLKAGLRAPVLAATHNNKRKKKYDKGVLNTTTTKEKEVTYYDCCDLICSTIAGLTAIAAVTNKNETELDTEVHIPIDNFFQRGEREHNKCVSSTSCNITSNTTTHQQEREVEYYYCCDLICDLLIAGVTAQIEFDNNIRGGFNHNNDFGRKKKKKEK